MDGPRTTLFLQTGPCVRANLRKYVPQIIPPSLQSCPLLASLPGVIGLTYLFWMLWCVPSRPTFLVATGPGHKPPDQRGPEPWTSLWVPPELCGLKPHPTVPGHRARMGWVCASLWLLHKQMQHGGAPGTEKGTCGRRDLGKHVTYCTRVASPCLGTCNIAAINTRVCSKHATLQGTCVISTYEFTHSALHTCSTCELLQLQYS